MIILLMHHALDTTVAVARNYTVAEEGRLVGESLPALVGLYYVPLLL